MRKISRFGRSKKIVAADKREVFPKLAHRHQSCPDMSLMMTVNTVKNAAAENNHNGGKLSVRAVNASENPSEIVFHIRDVSKIYKMGEVEVHALRKVNLDLYKGELAVLLGASGSGKSTLLNIIGGLDVPTSGEVIFRDHNLMTADEKGLTEYRRASTSSLSCSINRSNSATITVSKRASSRGNLPTFQRSISPPFSAKATNGKFSSMTAERRGFETLKSDITQRRKQK